MPKPASRDSTIPTLREQNAYAGARVLRILASPYSPTFREDVFSETELPEVVILEIVLMGKENEPQRWEIRKTSRWSS